MGEMEKITGSLREQYSSPQANPVGGLDSVISKVSQQNSQKIVSTRTIPLEETHVKLNDGTFVAKYDTYYPGEDNAEIYARTQSTGDKWLNGLLKLGGKTLTAIAGGTVGQVGGIVDLIKTGSKTSLYDNDIVRKLDDLNVTMDNKLPNYYTKEEKDMGLGESMLTANFWANDVLSGLSFTLGAIGTELVWGGLTGGSSLATLATRKAFMAGLKKTGKDLVKGSYKDIPHSASNLIRATNVGKSVSLLNTARFTYTSAGYEAGVEAFQFTKEMREGFYQDFLNKNGRAPEQADYDEFNENLTTSANYLYTLNTALVGSSNLITVGRLFNFKTPGLSSDFLNRKVFGVGVANKTKFNKIARLTYGLGKAPVTEGIYEEGLQGVGSTASEAWLKSKYDPKYSKESMSIGDAFYEGLAETYGTKEGWKGIGIGMIIGGISGTAVNRISGKGEFTEADQRSANQKAFQESYSGNQFMQALGLANRTQKLTEDYENSESATGQEMARKGQVINQLSYAYEMDSFEDVKEETLTAIDAVDTVALAKERGISESEALELKERIKTEYSSTADSFKKYREFAEYYIADNAKSEVGTSKEIKDAMAYQLAMGENSFNYSQEILNTLKQELSGFSSSLDLNDLINNATESTRKEFESIKQEISNLNKEKQELNNKRKSLANLLYGTNTEENTRNANELNRITQDLANLTEQEISVNFKLNNLVKSAEIENPFNSNQGRVVTNEQLSELDNVLREISEIPEKLSQTDLQKAEYINNLIDEYGISLRTFKQYADVSRQITSGKLQLTGKNIFGTKQPNEITAEFLQGLTETIGESKEQRAQDFLMASEAVQEVRNAEVVENVVQEETIEEVETPLQRIMRSNPYLQSLEEGLRTPTEEDVARFQYLSTKALYDENIEVFDEVEVIESDNLTEEESQELEELRNLLSNWQLFDGITGEGVKLSEVLEQTNQNQMIPQNAVEQPITSSEISAMADPDYTPKGVRGERPENVSQTAQNVQVRRDISDNATVHNISLPAFLENVDLPIFDEDGVEVLKTAIPNEIGTKLRVGESSITINSKGVIEVKGFQNILDNSNMQDFRYTYGKQSGYSFLYEDGKLKSSDFDVSDFNFEVIYDLKEGDELFLRVEADMDYNQSLSEEQLEGQLSISIVDSKGNKVGVLKSNQDIYGKDENFNLIRKRAVEVFKKGGGLINVQTTVEYTYLGTPNFEMENNAPKERPLPTDLVLDWGYYDGSTFQLVNGTKDVRGTFLAGINKKVPIIVFKRGNQVVAFPVELKGVASPKGADINNILLNGSSVASSVIEVNRVLLENGRSGDLYFLSPQDQNIFLETGEYTQVVKDHIEAMDQLRTFPDISTLPKESLPEAVAIAIDIANMPITSPKIVMKFGEPAVSEEVLQEEKPAKKVEKVLKKVTKNKVEERLNFDRVNSNTKDLPKKEREALKAELRDKVNSLPDDVLLLVHQTAEDSASNIFKNGFKLQGPAFESTFLPMSKETVLKVFSDLIDGKTMHQGATGAVIIGIPKSFYEGNAKIGDTFDILVEQGYDMSGLNVPKEFNLGFFNMGQLTTANEVSGTSPNVTSKEVAKNPSAPVKPVTTTPSEALTKEAKIIKEEPKGNVEVKQTENFADYTFKEGSTKSQFQALVEEGDRVIGPRDYFTATKGMLKSDKGGPLVPYPDNPKGWIIAKNKLVKPLSNTLKGRSKKEQNKKC